MPPFLIARVRNLRVLAWSVLLGSVVPYVAGLLDALGLLDLGGSRIRTMMLTYWSVLPVAVFALLSLALRRVWHVYSLVRAAEYRLCTFCGNSLQGLPDEHACPECGRRYVFSEVQSAWEMWFS
jgi:hypothetical protein